MNALCWFRIHKFGLMRSFRLCPSIVYTRRCYRCGSKESQ
jgi:hypothetical protein